MELKKTVGYSHSFIINGEWTKIWSDEELPPDTTSEEKRKKWYELRNEVHGFFYESNKAAEKQIDTKIVDVEPPENIDFMLLKKHVEDAETKEDAIEIINNSGNWKLPLTFQTKKIINNKPSKTNL